MSRLPLYTLHRWLQTNHARHVLYDSLPPSPRPPALILVHNGHSATLSSTQVLSCPLHHCKPDFVSLCLCLACHMPSHHMLVFSSAGTKNNNKATDMDSSESAWFQVT